MAEDRDIRLFLDVACCFQRVQVSLSGEVTHMAHQLDEATRHTDAFRENAFGHAEMLEREARNIRNAIAKHRNSHSDS